MNKEALKELDGFNGTSAYYRLAPFLSLVLTDGTRHLAQNADCFWLFNEIAVAQMEPLIRKDHALQGLQFWSLRPTGNGAAQLVCERDSGNVAWTKEIPLTDFPFDVLPKPTVWVAPTEMNGRKYWVAYLPSEH